MSSQWYFDFTTSNHMTNNDKSLSVHKYFGNLKFHTIGSYSLHITITSDVYPFLTDVGLF